MKTLHARINEAKQKLDIQNDTMNFINISSLQRYLQMADKFLLPETKEVIEWLIANNATYIKKLGGGPNAMETFYNNGVPQEKDLKSLYANLKKIAKADRLLEIPVFQTEEQFNAIINKAVSPDEIILDLRTEEGRNACAKKYDRLVWKIARSFVGKSNLTLDELYASGLYGLTLAMNKYGKKTEYTKADDETLKSYTFISFAAYIIRNQILQDIKDASRTVRVPVSAQQKEKAELGHNTKNNTISGDSTIKNGEQGSKTVFDFMSDETGGVSSDGDINKADLQRTWQEIFDTLEDKFDTRTMDIWYSFYELNGHQKLKNKELAQKYNMLSSNITYYLYLVNSYILKNKKLRRLFMDVKELVGESKMIADKNTHILNR